MVLMSQGIDCHKTIIKRSRLTSKLTGAESSTEHKNKACKIEVLRRCIK